MQDTGILSQQLESTLNKLTVAVREIADNVMITDVDGIIEYVNPAFEKTTGYGQMEAVGQTPRILNSGRHPVEFFRKLSNVILSGEPFHATIINKRKDGSLYYADQMISPIKEGMGGRISHFVSVWHDITPHVMLEHKLIELNRELSTEKKKLEEVLQVESGMGKSLNLHKMIDFAVEKAVAIIEAKKCSFLQADTHSGEFCIKGHWGIDEDRIGNLDLRLGDPIARLIAVHGDDPKGLEQGEGRVGQAYRSKGFLSVPVFAGERLFGVLSLSNKNNLLREFSDLDLQVLHMIVRQLAVAVENARLARELHYWEAKDNRLNIYNYRHCCRVLDYEISRAKRYGGQLSILMVNIDAFRFYNEALGLKEGDKFLQDFARMLDIHLRDIDTVCRYVGDEFVIILPGTDEQQAKIVAGKISRKTREMSVSYPMSVSIGVAQLASGMSRYDLVRKADGALRMVKAPH